MFAGDYTGAVAKDLGVVSALGDELADTGKTLIGIGMSPSGDRDEATKRNPRAAIPFTIADYGQRGVRTILVAIPPVTHSERDQRGFVPTLIKFARASGVSRYVGDGANRWPAAHVLDVGDLFALALDKAPSRAALCAAAETGVPVRTVAESIARHLDIPTQSIDPTEVAEHFPGFPFVATDLTMSSEATRQMLGWQPSRPRLLADLENGHYFAADA
ncbi:3-beta hydroxysteroid dehydrogenase [Streptomyces sp. NPDC059467]|uniref:3-beta hydroxysteroid dehydrogenase n=1 Tax=Streptomyces sp. NPDC059467 TaxID=3346844 RepID=UPI003683526E